MYACMDLKLISTSLIVRIERAYKANLGLQNLTKWMAFNLT